MLALSPSCGLTDVLSSTVPPNPWTGASLTVVFAIAPGFIGPARLAALRVKSGFWTGGISVGDGGGGGIPVAPNAAAGVGVPRPDRPSQPPAASPRYAPHLPLLPILTSLSA